MYTYMIATQSFSVSCGQSTAPYSTKDIIYYLDCKSLHLLQWYSCMYFPMTRETYFFNHYNQCNRHFLFKYSSGMLIQNSYGLQSCIIFDQLNLFCLLFKCNIHHKLICWLLFYHFKVHVQYMPQLSCKIALTTVK